MSLTAGEVEYASGDPHAATTSTEGALQ